MRARMVMAPLYWYEPPSRVQGGRRELASSTAAKAACPQSLTQLCTTILCIHIQSSFFVQLIKLLSLGSRSCIGAAHTSHRKSHCHIEIPAQPPNLNHAPQYFWGFTLHRITNDRRTNLWIVVRRDASIQSSTVMNWMYMGGSRPLMLISYRPDVDNFISNIRIETLYEW